MLHGHGDDIYQYPDIRMNFSSNIYSHADLSALQAHLRQQLDLIANYPEPTARSLEELLAKQLDIPADCILVTNGATEAIYLIAQMFREDGIKQFATDQPTFSEYSDACLLYGMEEGQGDSSLLWLCNPNNPDGRTYSLEEIRQAAHRYGWLVVDQSYEDYTLAPRLSAQEAVRSTNILQLHSMTKTYAVPGLRIGYVTGPAELMTRLRRFVHPWAVNSLAIEAGKWLVLHQAKAIDDLNAYLTETQRLRNALLQVYTLDVLSTATNFMLVHSERMPAALLKELLATQYHILIRDASTFPTLTPHHFRIATQSSTENDALISALKSIL